MRMIDADALRDNLQALTYDDWNQVLTTSWADAYSEVADMVEEMPTIEPKRGEWIDIMVGEMPAQACNQCNTFYPLSYTGGGHRYCPNCGAMMLRGNDHEDD